MYNTKHVPQILVIVVLGLGHLDVDAGRIDSVGNSSLSGYVYVDEDFDGVCDLATEWVLPGIEIRLTRADEPAFAVVTTTGASGFYEFGDLEEGTYTIEQTVIPDGYLTVLPCPGQLLDMATGQPTTAFAGEAVYYDQQSGIMPKISRIEISDSATRGVHYDFGQIWTGKAWYLTGGPDPQDPPGGNPPGGDPPGVPEPSGATGLVVIGLTLWGILRSARRPSGQ